MQRVTAVIRLLFDRGRWRWTLLLGLAVVIMVRLGFWQLDRLAQRRARNAQVQAQWAAPPLNLNTDPVPPDLAAIKYRRVVARGQFDPDHQFLLKNRHGPGGPGADIITPLIVEGRDKGILVNRGWVPYEMVASGAWTALPVPEGRVVVTAFVGLDALPPPSLASPSLPDENRALFYVDPEALASLLPYPLFHFYIVWMPEKEEGQDLPMKYTPQRDLSEGPHLGYAIHWFLFAAVVPVVYIYLLRRADNR